MNLLERYLNTDITICAFYQDTSDLLAYITGKLKKLPDDGYAIAENLNTLYLKNGHHNVVNVTHIDSLPPVIDIEIWFNTTE